MRYLKDTGIMFLLCFLTLFSAEPNVRFVLSFLIALIFCSTDYFLDLKKLLLPVSLIYLLTALVFPPLLYFLPAWSYTLYRHRFYVSIAALTALSWWTFKIQHAQTYLICLILFGVLLAFLLANNAENYDRITNLYKKTRDDSTELTLLLKQKNHSLLEKQDYEIYTATLRERNRIAREIHDNVGHLLSRSILMIGALRAINQEQTLLEPLATLDSTLNSAMDSIRNSVHDLHDEAVNLEEAINGLLKEFTLCPVSFQYDMGREIPREIKYSFISITKEALANIMKHSNATRVMITMREHPAIYQLCIEDNGTLSSPAGSGIGLINMEERVTAQKGTIKFRKENGFKIFITIPKEI